MIKILIASRCAFRGRRQITFAIALYVVGTACAPVHWEKPGRSMADFQAQLEMGQSEARKLRDMDSGGRKTVYSEMGFTDGCLAANGWVRSSDPR